MMKKCMRRQLQWQSEKHRIKKTIVSQSKTEQNEGMWGTDAALSKYAMLK